MQGSVEPLQFQISIGDTTAYDYASVVREGFFEAFDVSEVVSITLNEKLPTGPLRTPPRVDITRAPEASVATDLVTVSGVVTDDSGVGWVMAYHGDDKVFYDGSGRHGSLRSVPFTATVGLEPGPNTITVLARDVDGRVSTRSITTYRAEPEKQAQLVSEEPAR